MTSVNNNRISGFGNKNVSRKRGSSITAQSTKTFVKSKSIHGTINPSQHKLSKVYNHVYTDMDVKAFEELIDSTKNLFNHLIKHRGLIQGTKRFNDIRMYTLKHIAGLKPEPVKCLSTFKDGFPKDLKFLRKFKDNKRYMNIVYTILSISRLADGYSKDIDISSITRHPNRNNDFLKEIESFDLALPSILGKLNIPVNVSPVDFVGNVVLHETTSKGPNSDLSLDGLMSSHLDAAAIIADDKVNHSIVHYLEEIKRPDIYSYIQDTAKLVETNSSNPDKALPKKLICSRLAAIPQPGNKTRVVALFDYFSQALLKPLHKYLQKITENLPNSYVFDQDRGRELVKEFTEDPNSSPESKDASNWTDRFPMELQTSVLKQLFNEQYAKRVRHLLVHRDFKVSGSDDKVIYGAGQPMGAYPSFSLAHLTHCLYVYWKFSSNGEDPGKDTAVCGDDVCFRNNSKGTQAYTKGMEHLGVQFSSIKGYSSSASTIRIAEFCRRLYINGNDVSPVSPKVATLVASDFKYAGLLESFMDDSSFMRLILSYPDKYVSKALMLYSLPRFMTGLKREFKPTDPRAATIFNFENDPIRRQNILRCLCLHELSLLVHEQRRIRSDAYFDAISGIGDGNNESKLDPMTVVRAIQSSRHSRIYQSIMTDDSFIDVLKSADFIKSFPDRLIEVESGTIHPSLVVLLSIMSETMFAPRKALPAFIDYKGSGPGGLLQMHEIRSLEDLTDEDIELMIQPLKAAIVCSESFAEIPVQVMQRDNEMKKKVALVLFSTGTRVIKRILEYSRKSIEERTFI